MLEVLLQSLAQRVGDLVEADELSHPHHLGVVPRCSRVKALDDGRNVPKDAGIHQRCQGHKQKFGSFLFSTHSADSC